MAAQQDGDRGGERAVRTGWLVRGLMVLGVLVAVGISALGTVALVEAREDAWRQAEGASANLVLALERDVQRNITLYDLSLTGAIDALENPDIRKVSPEIRQAAIFDRSTSAEYLGSVVVLDPHGNIEYDSTSIEPHQLNLGDRDYFKVHEAAPHVGLFVSRPYRSRMRFGDETIAISRRRPGANGAFGGVVVGGMRLAYFHDLFATLKLGAHETIELVRTDGELVVRHPPGEEEAAGWSHWVSDLSEHFAAANAGQYVETSPDGMERAVTYRQIGRLPLLLVETAHVDDIFEAWRQKAIRVGLILVALCGAVVALLVLFGREMSRRVKAERHLREVAASLAVIAATDPLTGLSNRRVFEAELSQEWRRAIRVRGSVALLILDADWFKTYNDRYGHPAGDQVLKSLAECMEANIRRPRDLAARYGGEEFVALLPATGIEGAVATAERILAGVAALAVKHEESPLGVVSVSIGVAVARPSLGESEVHLLRRADAALYEAKRQGRARVCVAPGGEDLPAHREVEDVLGGDD